MGKTAKQKNQIMRGIARELPPAALNYIGHLAITGKKAIDKALFERYLVEYMIELKKRVPDYSPQMTCSCSPKPHTFLWHLYSPSNAISRYLTKGRALTEAEVDKLCEQAGWI